MSQQEIDPNAGQDAFQINKPAGQPSEAGNAIPQAAAPAKPAEPSAAAPAAPAPPSAPASVARPAETAPAAAKQPGGGAPASQGAAAGSPSSSLQQPAPAQAVPAQPSPNPAAMQQPAGDVSYWAQPTPDAQPADPYWSQPSAGEPQGPSSQFDSPAQGQVPHWQPEGEYRAQAAGQDAYTGAAFSSPAGQQSPAGNGYYAPPQPQSPYASNPNMPYVKPSPDGKAIGAMVCGIIGLFVCLVPIIGLVLGVIAIVLACVSRKHAGRSGYATAGLVTGIISTVIGVLIAVVIAVMAVQIVNDIDDYGTDNFLDDLEEEYGNIESGNGDEGGDNAVSGTFDDEDDQAAYDATVAVLDAMASPTDEAKANLADSINAGFKSTSQMDLEEIGVDPADIVEWMTDDASYEITSVTTYDDGTGSVSYTSHVRDVNALIEDFVDRLHEFRLSADSKDLSDDEMKQRIGSLMDDAMADNMETEDCSGSVDLQKFDGTWALTSDSLNQVPNDFYDTYWY